MELRHLRYFVTLADELHFGRAALRLGISQPPLSQQIKALEEELGARLLERTNRRVALTQAGRMFLSEARTTLAQAERAAQVARRAQRGELGELRIGMVPSAPLIPVVGRSILAFRRGFPDVQLTLDEFESRQQVQALAEGREHIAIIRGADPPTLPAGLLATELLREPLVVVMRADHALARRRGRLAMAALAEQPFVFYGPRMGTALPGQVLALCRAAGFEPRVSQIASANATILGLVAVGLGIAIVPQAMSRLRHAAVVTRAIADPTAITSVWILRRRDDRSPLVEAFFALAIADEGRRSGELAKGATEERRG
jgi:DNA-binding transcriptional LysR family regulator